jgi:hypothetical protein
MLVFKQSADGISKQIFAVSRRHARDRMNIVVGKRQILTAFSTPPACAVSRTTSHCDRPPPPAVTPPVQSAVSARPVQSVVVNRLGRQTLKLRTYDWILTAFRGIAARWRLGRVARRRPRAPTLRSISNFDR